MARAERWAAEKGSGEVRLRSNATRKDAHHFYEDINYGVHAV